MRLLQLGFGLLGLLSVANAADSVVWHPKARTFDMNVRAMGLEQLLGVIKAETGWEVLVEPGLEGRVAVKFRNKPAADAMRLLLDDKRFSLVPRAKGGTQLTVYARNRRGATQAVAAAMLAMGRSLLACAQATQNQTRAMAMAPLSPRRPTLLVLNVAAAEAEHRPATPVMTLPGRPEGT